MRFKLFGTEIYVSFLFMAVITAMLAMDRTGMVLPALFAVFMHEMGHLFAMWVLECGPKQIKLIPASVQIISPITRKIKNEIIIAVCGPAVNIILFLTFYFNYRAFKNELVLYYALINLLIGVFNLIPVTGLDGGTILFNLLCRKLDINKAMLILRIITLSVAAVVLFFGVWLALGGKFNLSFFIIGIYLLVMNLIKI